jgi:hypothetical protein
LVVQGFLVLDYPEKFVEAQEALAKAAKEGKIKLEGAETVVKTSFEGVPVVWSRVRPVALDICEADSFCTAIQRRKHWQARDPTG